MPPLRQRNADARNRAQQRFGRHLDQFAAGRDLDPLAAGLAAQGLLEGLFEALLADLHPRHEQKRILVLLFIFGRGRCADVADELADGRSPRIEAGEAL